MTTTNTNFKVKNGLDASGDITTSGDLKFSNIGTGAPTFNTYSSGVRSIHYDNVGATSVGYTTGIDAGVLWNSIPAADAGQSFKWYGGTTVLATLTGAGILTLNGIQSPAGVALPISTANNTTTSGAITIQTGTTSLGGNTSGAITVQTGAGAGSGNNSGPVTIKSGDGSGTTGNTGNIVVDSGLPAGSGTAGTVTIGGNAKTLNIGQDATLNQLGMSNANLTVSKSINIAGGLGSFVVATGATGTLSLNNWFSVNSGGTVSTYVGGGYSLPSGATSNIGLGEWGFGSGTQTINLGTTAFLSTINLRGNTSVSGSFALSTATSPITLNGQAGTNGQVLTSAGSGNTPTWTTVSGGGTAGVAWTGFAAGNYYYAQGGAQTNATPTLNTMTLVPFVLSVSTTFTKIGIYVNTGGVGSTVRLGIYNSTNGVASTRLLDAGTVATTTSSALALITINQTLAPGLYWLAAVSQGATCAAMAKGAGHVPMVPYLASPANAAARGHQVASVTGALPSPAGTLAMSSSPFEVFLQL